ncbi:uncharacterized protein TrAtP1_013266 [Trichoderma atroviride]|uniref:uncharacterized protein n=1 Tax=Hypocrea atroviridis TaxID=63577 RepID=UPI00332A5867|nr:hypothetical protein TrAtP1_013266 [Trichoderma atroviride]
MDPGEFVFIQEMGTGSHKPKTKSLIKMHVMDRVVMKRRGRKEEPSRGRDLTAESSRGDQSSSINQYVEHDDLRPTVGVDDMLRLSGFSLQVNTQTKILLHHFLNYTSKSLCTVTAETGWLKYAIEDSALFNSTLYHWAFLNYSFLPASFQSQQNLLALKAAAIRTLASQFQRATPDMGSDPPTFSDAMIATVACLANANFLCGDVEEAKVHFQGLRGMIRSRKGVLNLGFQGLAARIVRWTDCCHAQLSNMMLSFDEESSSKEVTPPPSTFLDSQGLYDQPSRWAMMGEIRSMSKELVATPKHLMAPDRRAALGFRLLASDRSILKRIHGKNGYSVLALFARGALLFSHVVLRGTPRSSRIITILVDQLKEALIFAYTSEDDIFDDHPIALVWLLLVGMLASGRENFQGIWFRLCLEKACGGDAGLSWEDVEALTETPNNISPQPFCWMLEEIALDLPCIHTSILC